MIKNDLLDRALTMLLGAGEDLDLAIESASACKPWCVLPPGHRDRCVWTTDRDAAFAALDHRVTAADLVPGMRVKRNWYKGHVAEVRLCGDGLYDVTMTTPGVEYRGLSAEDEFVLLEPHPANSARSVLKDGEVTP